MEHFIFRTEHSIRKTIKHFHHLLRITLLYKLICLVQLHFIHSNSVFFLRDMILRGQYSQTTIDIATKVALVATNEEETLSRNKYLFCE